MKKIFFTTIFLLFAFVTFAQTDTLKTKGRKGIPTVIGKWKQDSISSNSSQSKNTAPRTLEFKENGEFTEGGPTNKITGMWKIENGALIRDGRTSPIENMTMKKLVISGMEGKKKVYYYYSREDYKAPTQDVIPH